MKPESVKLINAAVIAVILCLLALSPSALLAAQVTLGWDANQPAPDGYRLYQSNDAQNFDYSSPVWSGQAIEHTVTGLDPNVTYYFVVRAFKGGEESGDSNKVQFPEPVPVIPPGGDQNSPADDPKDDAAPPQDKGSDGSPDPGHTPAGRPVLLPVTPYSGDRVSLTPILAVEPHFESASNSDKQTIFQISTSDDPSLPDFESFLVFEKTFTHHRTRFQVPALILDPDEDYYWRVRFLDSINGVSEWSNWSSFTTIDHQMADIADGIHNDQRIDPFDPDQWIVLDGADLQAEIDAGLIGVNTADALNPQVAVRQIDGNGTVVALRALHGADVPDLNRPEHLTGVISFKLHLEKGASTALVRVYFSRPAPPNAKWYKYDPDKGWSVYPYATFSADLRSVTLELEDGGTGDMDGVRNGVIVDPGGIGYNSQNTGANPMAASGSGGGCFMGISMQAIHGQPVQGVNATAGLFIVALAGLAIVGLSCSVGVRSR